MVPPSSHDSHMLCGVLCFANWCDSCVWHTWCTRVLDPACMRELRSALVVAHAQASRERRLCSLRSCWLIHVARRHWRHFRSLSRFVRSPIVRGRVCEQTCQTLCGSVLMRPWLALWSCLAFGGDAYQPREYAFSPRRDRRFLCLVCGPGTAIRIYGAIFKKSGRSGGGHKNPAPHNSWPTYEYVLAASSQQIILRVDRGAEGGPPNFGPNRPRKACFLTKAGAAGTSWRPNSCPQR